MASIQKFTNDEWTVATATALTSASTSTVFSAGDSDNDLVVMYVNGTTSGAAISIIAGDYQNAGDNNIVSSIAANAAVVVTMIDGTKYRGNDADYTVSASLPGAATGNLYVFQKQVGVA